MTKEPIMAEKKDEKPQEADVEGHVRARKVEESTEDTEGHVMPGEYDRDGRGMGSKRPGQGQGG